MNDINNHKLPKRMQGYMRIFWKENRQLVASVSEDALGRVDDPQAD